MLGSKRKINQRAISKNFFFFFKRRSLKLQFLLYQCTISDVFCPVDGSGEPWLLVSKPDIPSKMVLSRSIDSHFLPYKVHNATNSFNRVLQGGGPFTLNTKIHMLIAWSAWKRQKRSFQCWGGIDSILILNG